MKRLLLSLLFPVLAFVNLEAQRDCPAIPTNSEWDTTCYIPTQHKDGKLLLPQAFFANKYNGPPGQAAVIPENRPTWALGMAHAWGFSRNINKSSDYPKISYWMATVTQESQWGCDAGAIWSGLATGTSGPNLGSPVGITVPAIGDDGCFQIEGVNNGSAYGALIQYYPLRFRRGEHPNLIGGDNVATAAMVKAYYDLFTEKIAEYRWGWPYIETIENACEPYAFEKLSASAYNTGIYGFQVAQSYMGNTVDCYWTGLPGTTAGYATDIGDMMSVLEQNTSYPVTTFDKVNSRFLGYYEADITWSDMLQYFDEMGDLYWEYDFSTEIEPLVKAKWESMVGSTAVSINFQDIGPIIDVMILALPREDAMGPAMTIDGAPVGANGVKCSGEMVPYSYIRFNGPSTFCEGLSLELEADVVGGGGANPTFQWFKDGVAIAAPDGTGRTYIVNEAKGDYNFSLEVCNGTACNMAACDVMVTVEDCGGCGMTVSTTTVNTPCKGMEGGTINFNISGNSSNDYKVQYEGTTSRGPVAGVANFNSSSGSFTNLPDGDYNLIVTDNTTADCRAFTIGKIRYTTFVNEYVEGDIIKIEDCKADLEANIIELPAPCQFLVQVGQAKLNFPAPGDKTSSIGWEQWVNAIIQPSNGGAQTVQLNTFGVDFKYNDFTTLQADFGRYYFTMSTGDSINLYSQLLTGIPGSTQASVYKYEVYDDAGDRVFEGYSIPGTASSGNGIDLGYVGTYKAQCPYTPPAYDFAWAPAITNQVDTDIKSNGSTVVSPIEDKKVVVTATNRANSQCFTTDTIIVPMDAACVPSCDDPGTVTLSEVDTLELCTPISKSITTTITATSGLFSYQLFKNNGLEGTANSTGSFTIESPGDYYVQVVDVNDGFCLKVSNTITIRETTVPVAPTFSKSTSTVCANLLGVVYEIDEISNAGSYTWNYTGTGVVIDGSGASVTIDYTNATSGNLEVTAINSCGNSSVTSISITVDAIPSLVVSDPVAQCGGSINLISSTAVIQTITPTDALVSVYSDPTATTAVADSVTSSGNYYLQATNGTCKSSAALVKVEINTTPSLPSASDVELCEGDELKLAVSSPETALTYIWSAKTATNSFSGSGDLAVVASASTKTTDEGTYEVTASENGCTSDPKTVTVSIDGKPNDAAVSSTSLDVCSVDPIALNADAATNNGIGAWTSTGTGAITSTNNPTSAVTGMSGGDQLVATWTVASENGYCASTDATVTINAVLATDPTVSLAQDKTEACEGDVIVFEAKPTTGGTAPLYTFYDFTGNVRGAVLQAESPLATYTTNAATTNLEIEVELKSNSSCIASSSIATAAAIVQVDETPSNATIIEGATLSTCVETESLTSEPIASGLASWSVTNGPGSTANETATGTDVTGLVPSQSTEITFTVASENGYCNANTDVISIDRLGEITKATVSSQSGSLCEDAPFSTLTGNTLQALESASWAALTTGATIDASTGIISSWVEGENQFEYTIANTGSCTDADIVTITIDKVPTTASLSSAATIVTCTDPVNLNANPLTDGSGLWTIVSGNGNLVSGQETSPTAQVENLDETTDLVLAWTTSNGACSNHSTTEVTVDKAGELTSAEITVDGNLILEGETAIVCKDNFTLASSVPSTSGGNTESGTWAIGDASVVAFSPGSSNSPLPTVSSSDKGTTTLSWEISTSLAGCLPSKRTIELEVVDVPVTGTLSKSTLDALCETQEETFTTVAATSATSYEWAIDGTVAGETSSVFVNSFDTYGTTTVSVVAKNSCGADLTPESIDVIVNAVPQLATSSYSACENGTDVELTPLVNITPVLVQDASLTFTNEDGIELSGSTVNESGNYFVTASKDGCTSSSSMIVVEIKPIPSQATLTSTSACVGGDFKVQISNASPLQTYTWTTPQGVASGEELEITNAQLSDEGDYSVIVEQAGCLSITPGVENIELKKTPAPELLLEGGIVSDAIAPVIVCVEDLPKDLQVGNLFESETTEWDYEGQTIDKGQIFESGLYTLTADNGTCTGVAAVEIEVRVLEAIISREPSAVDQGSEVTFRGTVEPYNPDYTYEYTWKGNIHNTIGKGPVLDFVPNETDDYWVTVDELETGCQAESEEKNVIVYLPVTIPAAFTPNGDGANEKWVIIGLETYEKASIKVFNRWGHIVYKSTGNNYEGWDGLNLSGKDVTTGTYYYIIRLNDVLGRVYQGDVTVIR